MYKFFIGLIIGVGIVESIVGEWMSVLSVIGSLIMFSLAVERHEE